MNKTNNYGGTIVTTIVLLVILAAHVAFGSENENRKWEFTPYTDFYGSLHGGVGSHYDGLGLGMNIGCEFLAVATDKFAIGIDAGTGANYDVYQEIVSGGSIMDEYWIWTFSAGVVIYIGDMFYVGAKIVYNADIFYEDTYFHDSDGNDTSIEKKDYDVDEFDYTAEIGFRVDFHAAVYLMGTTHFVENEQSFSKYQLYAGVKFFF